MDITSIIKNIKEMLMERGDDISLFEEHELSVDKEEYENDRNTIEFQTSNTTVIFALTKKLKKYIIVVSFFIYFIIKIFIYILIFANSLISNTFFTNKIDFY